MGRSQAGGLLDILCLRTHTGTHAAQISPVSYRVLWGGGGGWGGLISTNKFVAVLVEYRCCMKTEGLKP